MENFWIVLGLAFSFALFWYNTEQAAGFILSFALDLMILTLVSMNTMNFTSPVDGLLVFLLSFALLLLKWAFYELTVKIDERRLNDNLISKKNT